jgi:nucleoside-diphosphate-sugar epimerase
MNPLATDLDHVLAHTTGLWDELRGKRIFITGGTGFFGCWLLESFAWANDKLGLNASALVLTRNVESFRKKASHLASHPAIQFQAGDIRSFEFPKGNFSHIIHAATEASAKLIEENPLLMFDTIVEGTRRTLEFARQAGAAKLLFTSSGAVHGPSVPGRGRLREEDGASAMPLEPRCAYAEAKRTAEMLCALFGRENGSQTKIARGFAFLGPYLPLDAHFAAGNFIRDALCGNAIVVRGSGTAVRSYLYGADLAVWLWTILICGAPGRPYNVGSDEAISVADLARAVARECDPPPQVRVLGHATEGEPVDFYVPDITRARGELGLNPTVGLPDAIRRTLRWHREQSRL